MSLRVTILAGLAILGIGLLAVWQFAPSVFAEARSLLEPERLETLVARAGLWGPVLIVTLMTIAVVASPIPSAPIALAAGAACGHLWGTVQVVIGAELGALIAFGLARVLGHDVLRRVFGDRVDAGLLGSQNALTATVLASRLMPFLPARLGLHCEPQPKHVDADQHRRGGGLTLENNGKIRPQPDRENAFVVASGGGDGPDVQPSLGRKRVEVVVFNPRAAGFFCDRHDVGRGR